MNYLIITFLTVLQSFFSPNPELTLQFDQIKAVKGTIEIGIFNKSDLFLKKGKAFKTYSIKVTKKRETISIKDLPKGTYAISAYHDVNGDTVCNRNFLGIPKEPYAFSNNFKPKFSAPTFNDCSFVFNEKNEIITLSFIH